MVAEMPKNFQKKIVFFENKNEQIVPLKISKILTNVLTKVLFVKKYKEVFTY